MDGFTVAIGAITTFLSISSGFVLPLPIRSVMLLEQSTTIKQSTKNYFTTYTMYIA